MFGKYLVENIRFRAMFLQFHSFSLLPWSQMFKSQRAERNDYGGLHLSKISFLYSVLKTHYETKISLIIQKVAISDKKDISGLPE